MGASSSGLLDEAKISHIKGNWEIPFFPPAVLNIFESYLTMSFLVKVVDK